ncbi:FKBP-type peptidyl-prolyl cis-trans isomerase family protein [Klebsormidium nitens]|uniref:peptidylprolyl isomerase n=1 Tax=Klebsormidium nitens TaxID=105231 RepID=A0A1Y1HRT5_KLENI|nr:FKBP-type peptidyl-prolyl cis-trans isomerase family protein [Klebsormidium nitens]|eukprot:GAQ80522.1 FKBP-type peptidyl-prolyl cis-trans isomerase family protein [Klebsormidium nitens]
MAAAQACCALGCGSSSLLLERTLWKRRQPQNVAFPGGCKRNAGISRESCRLSGLWQCGPINACAKPNEVSKEGISSGPSITLSRRALASLAIVASWLNVSPGQARERRQQKVDDAEYSTSEEGLKYYDFNQGRGPEAVKGKKVVVHFDCVYKTLTVVSSRSSKLLGGNRVIAQPYELVVGSKPGSERKRDFVDNANGLFSAQAAPKPPPALYSIVEGMRVGGKRTVIVPPELGYGQKGVGEIPPGATFDLNIELLEVEDVRKDA